MQPPAQAWMACLGIWSTDAEHADERRQCEPFSSASVEFKDGKAHIRTCFTAGTLVHTKDGTKVIEDIQIGDVVLSKSDVTGEVSYKKVVNTFIRQTDEIYNVNFTNNSILETTWNHPFRRFKSFLPGDAFSIENSEWTEARDLKKGDQVYSADGSLLVVESVIIEQREETVYNFEVENFHTYFVGEDGVWVHNDECSGNNTTALVESLVKCGSISGSCANKIFEKHKEVSRIDAEGQAIGGAIGLTALTCVALCGPATYSIATSRLGQILGLSTPVANKVNIRQMFRSALRPYNDSGISNVARELSKHKNIAELTGTVSQKNKIAAEALKNIIRNGSPTFRKDHPRFGNILDIKLNSGIGARFNTDTNEFIHLLGR